MWLIEFVAGIVLVVVGTIVTIIIIAAIYDLLVYRPRREEYVQTVLAFARNQGWWYSYQLFKAHPELPRGYMYPLLNEMSKEGLLKHKFVKEHVPWQAEKTTRLYYHIASGGGGRRYRRPLPPQAGTAHVPA